MLTMHPTLLVGPYDWEPDRIPKEEFLQRGENFWAEIADPTCAVAMVYGDSRNHAELAYLSNFIPKLGPALLLFPREGEPTLLVSGAPNMLPAARRITWIERTQSLSDVGEATAQWMTESGASNDAGVALVGGEYMRAAFRRSFSTAFAPEHPPAEATSLLQTLMRYKRPVELRLMREACSMLSASNQALAKAKHSGAEVTAAILAAEAAAHQAGAQDIRTLFSVDGGRTLRPFEAPIARSVDPLQAYIAVRHAGYWAEGFVLLAESPHSLVMKVAVALKSVIKVATAGTSYANLARVVAEIIGPHREHSVTKGNMGNGIGLSLVEEPCLLANSEESLAEGGVYTLRVGASDGEHHVIMSAMIAVHQRGNSVLWSSTEASRAREDENDRRVT